MAASVMDFFWSIPHLAELCKAISHKSSKKEFCKHNKNFWGNMGLLNLVIFLKNIFRLGPFPNAFPTFFVKLTWTDLIDQSPPIIVCRC